MQRYAPPESEIETRSEVLQSRLALERQMKSALVFSLCGLFGFFPMALWGVARGAFLLRRASATEGSSRTLAVLAIWIGALALVIWALLIWGLTGSRS